MTREITLEEIPEMHRNTLASEKQNFYYIFWTGLNQEQQLEECYFLSNDFVNRNILINR